MKWASAALLGTIVLAPNAFQGAPNATMGGDPGIGWRGGQGAESPQWATDTTRVAQQDAERGSGQGICAEGEGVICPGEEHVFEERESSPVQEQILGEEGYEAAIEDEDGPLDLGSVPGIESPASALEDDGPDIWGEDDDDGWLE